MKLPLLILLMLAGTRLFCQQKEDIPAYGKIDKSDLLLKECDFDKNAEALVLFDVEEAYCKMYIDPEYQHQKHLTRLIATNNLHAGVTRHVRIKILNNKGMEMANIKIYYLNGHFGESFDNIDAQTYNLDEAGNIVVTKLNRNAFTDQAVTGNVSEKVFTFADVKVGSVLEYSYKVTGTLGVGLRDWHFQSSIPCKLSRYSLAYSPSLEITSMPFCSLPVTREERNDQEFNVSIFTMSNVPALRNEPFMSCEKDYLQRVESKIIAVTAFGFRTNLNPSWPDVVQSLMKDDNFGLQISKDIPRTDDLDNSLKNIVDPYEKMAVIYRYVRKYMEWNGRTSFVATDGVKAAWKQRKGNSSEINLILVNLLRGAKLDAHPILLSTRANGRVNTTYPTNQEFNKVMAYLEINSQIYVLDATDKYGTPNLIPWEVMFSDGLVIDKFDYNGGSDSFKWLWASLWDEKEQFRDVVQIIGSIDQQGLLTGDATIKSYDYSRSKRIADLNRGKSEFIDKYFGAPNPGVHIDSSSIENDQTDSLPLSQKIWFNEKISSTGNYKYFSTNLFTGLEKNPFTSENRSSDIFFGANQKYTFAANIFIPDGFSIDAMPKSVRMRLPDSSIVFTRVIQAEDDHVAIREDLEFNKPVFSVSEYSDFQLFYKKLFELLNEPIAIKKN